MPDFEAALRWAMKWVAASDREALWRKSLAQNLNAAMVGLVEVLHCQTTYTCQITNWQEKFNLQAFKIVELDAQIGKQKEENAKLEASLKEIEERRMCEIAELFFKMRKGESSCC